MSCCESQWPNMLPNTVTRKINIGSCPALVPRLLTPDNVGCLADIKHRSTLHRESWWRICAHLDMYPQHTAGRADTIETCEGEAPGKRGQPKRSSLTHPDSGIVLTDVTTDGRRKCSAYHGNGTESGWKGYAENQRGMKNVNVDAEKKKRKLKVECICQILQRRLPTGSKRPKNKSQEKSQLR